MKRAIIGLAAGFLNGLLGSGGGTVIVPALEYFQKLQEHRAHATALAVILPLSALSTLMYLFHGSLVWSVILPVGAGSIIGSALGAVLLKKLPSGILNKLFGLVMIIAAIRMLLG